MSYTTIIDSTNLHLFQNKAGELLRGVWDEFEALYSSDPLEALPFSSRGFAGDLKLRRKFDLKVIAEHLKIKGFDVKLNSKSMVVEGHLKITSGEGSRNKKAGGGKAGKEFEEHIARELGKIKFGGSSCPYVKGIEQECSKLGYDLTFDDYDIDVEGHKNQKRSMVFENGSIKTNPSGDIGRTVSDITLSFQDGSKIPISLKYTSQYFLVNMSLRKYLHDKEPTKDVPERNQIIKYFGFNPKEFLTPYNLHSTDDSIITDVEAKVNWENVIKESIGYGYLYVVGGGKNDITTYLSKDNSVKVDEILQRTYAVAGVRKYSKIKLLVTIGNKQYKLDCQFRGTTADEVLPYYLRIMVL